MASLISRIDIPLKSDLYAPVKFVYILAVLFVVALAKWTSRQRAIKIQNVYRIIAVLFIFICWCRVAPFLFALLSRSSSSFFLSFSLIYISRSWSFDRWPSSWWHWLMAAIICPARASRVTAQATRWGGGKKFLFDNRKDASQRRRDGVLFISARLGCTQGQKRRRRASLNNRQLGQIRQRLS